MCVCTLLFGSQILVSECLAKKDGGGVKDHNGGKSIQLTWAALHHVLIAARVV